MKVPFYLFGTGRFSDLALEKLKKEELYGYIDNSENKIGTLKNGFIIESFNDFIQKDLNDVWIVIAVNKTLEMEIAEQLLDVGVTKFVFFDEIDLLIDDNLEVVLSKHNIKFVEYYRKIEQQQRERISFFLHHLDPKGIQKEKGYKRERQLEQVEYAERFFDELYKINIHPFLTCGNLLGKYRHNGFIPWDDDLDFGLFSDEYERLIEYCEKNYNVITINKSLSNLDVEEELKWIDCQLHKNKDGFLLVYPTQLQFNIGNNFMNRIAIDFWCFDSYGEVSFDVHKKLVDKLKNEVINGNYGEQFNDIAKLKELEKPYIDKNGKNVYFSLNSGLSIMRTNSSWIDKDIIFPLQTIDYEGVTLYAPNKIKEYLHFEYKDADSLPYDCGIEKHFYRNEYIRKNYYLVEFYLVDAFEIYHFMPLYKLLRERGVYAIFVAEPEEINTVGKWFDYKTAIRILNDEKLEYVESCNIDADIAFTTQFPHSLRKYRRALKVNMTYGCSFNRNAFWFDNRAIRGFDFKLVGGSFIKQRCLENGELDEEHILIMGSPKHYGLSERQGDGDTGSLKIMSDNKKILCYFPTWDEDSSIVKFSNAIEQLKDHYYIITKPHHCTFRLAEKKYELELLYKISDIVLDGNYNFENVANIGDVRLCDAKSGAALETILINQNIPTVFLSVQENIESYYYPEMEDVASAVVYNPLVLKETVENVKPKTNTDMNRYFDCSKNDDDLWDILSYIIENVKGKEKVYE